MCARARVCEAAKKGAAVEYIDVVLRAAYPLTVSSSNTICIPVSGRYPGGKSWHLEARRRSARSLTFGRGRAEEF